MRPARKSLLGLVSLGAAAAVSLLGNPALAAPAPGAVASTTAQPANVSGPRLGVLAQRDGRYFGSAFSPAHQGNAGYTAIAQAQFNMFTPENEMKWDTTEPSSGVFNFGPGDAIVSFAQQNGARVRGHNLVWHSQLPAWVTALPQDQVQGAMENHITTQVSHYKGEIYAWDVVNEPFNEDGTLRQDVFSNAMGPDYIADALRTAHAADPDARLYLNDFNIEGLNPKSDAMYNLVKSLKAQGVPIDGVGLESHFILGQVPSTMLANMQRFAALGVDVAVTELDDRMTLPATDATLAQQADEFAAVVNNCLAVPRCPGVTQWAVGDADSWIPGTFAGQGAATMYDENYQPKPSYFSVVSALKHFQDQQ
jgi:endo-1,4-beta-xylanase